MKRNAIKTVEQTKINSLFTLLILTKNGDQMNIHFTCKHLWYRLMVNNTSCIKEIYFFLYLYCKIAFLYLNKLNFNYIKSGLPRVREKSGKNKFYQGQGKVREFQNWSGKIGVSAKVREKSIIGGLKVHYFQS